MAKDDLNKELEALQDPLAQEDKEARATAKAAEKRRKKAEREKAFNQDGQILRVEDIDPKKSEDIDVDDVISTYIPQRRLKRLGAAILRLDKLRLFLLLAIILVAILFLMSFLQEKMGNFTINLDRLELYRKGVSMSADPEFSNPTARLVASPVEDATNITFTDIPGNVSELDGDHNGLNYMAYTYYVRNAGKEDVDYTASIVLESCSKGAEKAVRVALWANGERTIYAAPSSDGTPEEGCENFVSDSLVCSFVQKNFLVGNVDRYTVVIWLEGEDPECVDAIVGGSVEFEMRIAAYNDDDTTLLQKYIQDIRDTLSGNKPISAAGTDNPDFAWYEDVNWYTRRNQDEYQKPQGVKIN